MIDILLYGYVPFFAICMLAALDGYLYAKGHKKIVSFSGFYVACAFIPLVNIYTTGMIFLFLIKGKYHATR